MKNMAIYISLILITLSFCGCESANGNVKEEKTTVSSTEKIEVYYFHYTRRCATCMAVEEETQNVLKQLYQDELNSNKVTFQSINLDEASSEEVAKKLGVSGQALLIVSGEQKENITTDAFMYAKSNPDKLKEVIKKNMDSFLN